MSPTVLDDDGPTEWVVIELRKDNAGCWRVRQIQRTNKFIAI
jgi:hypothetical protein